jgi:hypothetical protein
MSGTYKDIEVWQADMKMVFDVYRDTATLSQARNVRLVEPTATCRRVGRQ